MTQTDVEIRSTAAFEEGLARLPVQERRRIMEKIKSAGTLLQTDRKAFYSRAHRPAVFRIGNGFESSLHVLRPMSRVRVVVAVDEDPVFRQVILTLLKVLPADTFESEIGKVARDLYAGLGSVKRMAGGRTNGKK